QNIVFMRFCTVCMLAVFLIQPCMSGSRSPRIKACGKQLIALLASLKQATNCLSHFENVRKTPMKRLSVLCCENS
ncbi:hypothetical protein PMAYCL1PPCAC_04736, partial [Pristionchus mayeri]